MAPNAQPRPVGSVEGGEHWLDQPWQGVRDLALLAARFTGECDSAAADDLQDAITVSVGADPPPRR